MDKSEVEQVIFAWMDTVIYAYNLLGMELNPEGNLQYHDCPRCISVHTSDKEIHLTNLEKLAEFTGLHTQSVQRVINNEFWKETSLMYRGYKFFEVEKL